MVNDLGADVDGAGADSGPAKDVVAEIVAAGGTAIANADSVATRGGARAIVQAAVDAFGRVDILVTNAGIMRQGPFVDTDPESFEAMLDVHTRQNWNLMQAAWPRMAGQHYGRVVCITSSAGIFGNEGISGYATSKAALTGLLRSAALEGAAAGIVVNGLAPGASSRMNAGGGAGREAYRADHQRPEFVSPVVVVLAHEDCPVTGRIFAAIGHRMAEIVLAETRGFSADVAEWTPERIRDSWSEVVDRTGMYSPLSVADAARFSAEASGIDLAAYGITPAPAVAP